jgi:hypothetical protein
MRQCALECLYMHDGEDTVCWAMQLFASVEGIYIPAQSVHIGCKLFGGL